MEKKIRANVLRLPEGIRPESIQRAEEVVKLFAEHLRTLPLEAAATKTAKATGTKAEINKPKNKQ